MRRYFTQAMITLTVLGMVWGGSQANALTILTESFETDGIGSRYSVKGAGSSNDFTDFWGRFDTTGTAFQLPAGSNFFGQDGNVYFAGRDLNGSFGGGTSPTNPRNVTLNPLDVSSLPEVQLTVSLAAIIDGKFESTDFLRLSVDKTNNGTFTTLDEFYGISGSLSNGTTSLGATFADFTYYVTGATDLVVRIEAHTSKFDELVAFDNIRLTDDVAPHPTPEPGTWVLLGTGLVGMFGYAWRRKKDTVVA